MGKAPLRRRGLSLPKAGRMPATRSCPGTPAGWRRVLAGRMARLEESRAERDSTPQAARQGRARGGLRRLSSVAASRRPGGIAEDTATSLAPCYGQKLSATPSPQGFGIGSSFPICSRRWEHDSARPSMVPIHRAVVPPAGVLLRAGAVQVTGRPRASFPVTDWPEARDSHPG